MEMTAFETKAINELIHHDRSNPIRAPDLAVKIGLDLRGINATVRDLRRKGVLVGASKKKPAGYYLPGNENEIREYMAAFKAELFDMIETYRIQRKASREFLANCQNGDLFINNRGQILIKF